MIIIKRPSIEIVRDKARLISTINIDNKTMNIFFEVEKKYSKYLTFERADSFLVGLLPYAVANNHDIISEAPLSSRLLYQITEDLIPSLAKFRYHTELINVSSEVTSTNILKGKAVGTGLSCGVDSFETISSHIDLKDKNFNITHALFLNVGSHGIGKKADELYLQRLNLAKNAAKDLDLELVHINSNIGNFLGSDYVNVHTYLSSSAVLSMQKLFKTYYYASGYPISEFKISENSTAANFDFLTLSSVSTENLQFYTTGIEKTRLDKVKVISNFEPSYRWLNVCTRSIENCGKCGKCIRTQLELYSIDKLNLYEEVFDIKKFNKKRNSYIGYALANKKNSYNNEIIQSIKTNKKIPLSSYLYSVLHFNLNILKNVYKTFVKP